MVFFPAIKKLPSRTVLITCVLLWLSAAGAWAHSFNESYVYFDVTETTLGGNVQVNTRDLARVLARDGTVEKPLTENEVLEHQQELFAYFEERLLLSHQGQPYQIVFDNVSFLPTKVGNFALLHFDVLDIVETPTTIEMSFDALFGDIDPTHRGYALIATNTRNGMEENEGYISLVFAPGDGIKELYLNDEPTKGVALTFLEHGVWHIWLGFDHVLFLIALLLSSVMVIKESRWEPASDLKRSLKNTVKIVTVFTLAHTVTLCLATFEIVTLPVVLVEAVIAISIAVVALGNLYPRLHAKSWVIVFIFGLFHGFGFANVLEPLGLDPARKAIGLFAFNVGVELGQLAIVLAVFPIFFAMRRWPAYRFVALQVTSVALIAISVFWFVERTAGVPNMLGEAVVELVE